jgi:hypothetical protein
MPIRNRLRDNNISLSRTRYDSRLSDISPKQTDATLGMRDFASGLRGLPLNVRGFSPKLTDYASEINSIDLKLKGLASKISD